MFVWHNSVIKRLAAVVFDKPPMVYQVQMPPGSAPFVLRRSYARRKTIPFYRFARWLATFFPACALSWRAV